MAKNYYQPEIETMPVEQLKALQSERLVKQVQHVWDNVPYYRAKMEEKGVTQYRLIKMGIDNKTLDSLKKNNNITLLTLEKLCRIVGCTPNEVVRFVERSSDEV